MIISALLGLLGGLLIGGRFRVFALMPAMGLGLIVTAGLVGVGHLTVGTAALAFLCFAAFLQAGYGVMLLIGVGAKRPLQARPLTT